MHMTHCPELPNPAAGPPLVGAAAQAKFVAATPGASWTGTPVGTTNNFKNGLRYSPHNPEVACYTKDFLPKGNSSPVMRDSSGNII